MKKHTHTPTAAVLILYICYTDVQVTAFIKHRISRLLSYNVDNQISQI